MAKLTVNIVFTKIRILFQPVFQKFTIFLKKQVKKQRPIQKNKQQRQNLTPILKIWQQIVKDAGRG